MVFLLTLGIVSNSLASEEIVFDAPEAMYTKLQQGQMCEDTLTLQNQKVDELSSEVTNLEKENEVLKEQINLLNQKSDALEKVVVAQDKAIDDMQKIIDNQRKNYEEAIKVSKPSFVDQLKDNSFLITIGIIIGHFLL